MRRISNDPLRAQAYRTQRPESPEDLWQPLYDRVNIKTAVPSQLSFFSSPRGQTVNLIMGNAGTVAVSKTKSFRDTNMENSNVIPTKLFKFTGVSIAYVHASRSAVTNAEDRDLIRDGAEFHIRIIDKDILHIPLMSIPELNPIISGATTATATTILSSAGGGGANIPMYKFPIPITLEPFQNFNVNINFDVGTAITLAYTMDIYVVLQGYMRRPT